MKRITRIIIIFLIIFMLMGIVNAEEYNLEDINDNSTLSEVNQSNSSHIHTQLSDISDSPVKASTIPASGGTFTQLQAIITSASDGDVIYFAGDYRYDSSTDSSLINGITISKSLTFEGNGHSINGNGQARIFSISSGTIILSNIKFINSWSNNADYSGAVNLYGSTIKLTVEGCSFINDTARASNANAGGINARLFDTLIVNNSYFDNNSNGAGQYNVGGALSISNGNQFKNGNVFILNNSRFYNNYLESVSGIARGAAVYVYEVDAVSITNCIFVNNSFINSASTYGGAINFYTYYWTFNNVNVTNNMFYSNGGTYGVVASGQFNSGVNGNFNNNWYGSNSPDLSNLIYGITLPETYVVMNLTNITPVTGLVGDTATFSASLNTFYNRTSGTYSPLNGGLHEYGLDLKGVGGTFNTASPVNFTNNVTVSFTCDDPNFYIAISLDNETLYFGTGNILVNVSVSDTNPQVLDMITYNITVSSASPSNLTNIKVYFDNNFQYISANSTGTYDSSTKIWTINSLSPWTSESMEIKVMVPYNDSLINTIIPTTVFVNVSLNSSILSANSTVNVNVKNITNGSYTVLQSLIDNTPNNGIIDLPFNIVYNPDTDSALINGMKLNKSITIKGNGLTISGKGLARIFDITDGNILLENITLRDSWSDDYTYCGAVNVWSYTVNLTINYCNFTNNHVYTSNAFAAGINARKFGTVIVNNSYFENHTNGGGQYNVGAAIGVAGENQVKNGNRFILNNSVLIGNYLFNTTSMQRGAAVMIYEVDAISITNNIFINNSLKSSSTGYGGAIDFYAYYWSFNDVNVTNNIFLDNYGSAGSAIACGQFGNAVNGNLNNNWYGTNTPDFTKLFWGINPPETWVIMNFTSPTPFATTGDNIPLTASLSTVYNSTSGNYSNLTGTLPQRTVTFNSNSGSYSTTTTNITDNVTTIFSYSGSPNSLKLDATIDNQTLTLLLSDLDLKLNVSNLNPQIGNVIQFTLNITNNGPNDIKFDPGLEAVVVNFSLPSSFTVLNATGNYSNADGLWYVGNLTVGESKSINITVKIPLNGSLIGEIPINATLPRYHFISTKSVEDNLTLNITTKISGSYTELQELIDNTTTGGVLSVPWNVIYDPVTDAWLQTGMKLNKSITLMGNGFTISGSGQARIFLITSSNIVLSNLTFVDARASSDGGAFYGTSISNFTVYNSTFINNTCTGTFGGVAYLTGSGINFTDCDFINNSAYHTGCLDIRSSSNFNLVGCSFVNSVSNTNVGAVYLESITGINVFNCSFINNTAFGSSSTWNGVGGALYIATSNNILVNHSVFVNNTATRGGGMCSHGNGANYIITNCVFVDNVATSGTGSAVANVGIVNNNWWGNNTPILTTDSLIQGTKPETWIIMNFTTNESINLLSSGTINLDVALNTLYNQTSSNFSTLVGGLPIRNVTYSWNTGYITPTISNISNYTNANFTYPAGLTNAEINAKIDNQILTLPLTNINITITNITKIEPQIGDRVTFTINVTNNGPYNISYTTDLEALIVKFNLTSPLIYLNNIGDGQYYNDTGLWFVGNLSSGETKTINITCKVPFNKTLINTTVSLNASIHGGHILTVNPNIYDNATLNIKDKTSGSYTDLQDLIDDTPAGEVLSIGFNVTYDPIGDAWLIGGMYLNKSITLESEGSFISGLNQARIFQVTGSNIVLSNFTFLNAYGSGNGGAFYGIGFTNFTVYNSTFINNTCTGNFGGVAYLTGSGINFTDCDFINNSAYHTGCLDIRDSSNLELVDCSFVNSVSNTNVGAVYLESITGINVFNCSFINNTAFGSSSTWNGVGGALYIATSNNILVNHSVFVNNTATRGGGMCSHGNGANYIITNCVFVDNVATSGTGSAVANVGIVNNNWWGNNTPILTTDSLIQGTKPETWIIMNFTNTTPITTTGGTATLLVTLNTTYNITSNTTSDLIDPLPQRTVYFNWTTGNITPNTTNIQNQATTTFTYPNNMGKWIVSATIDNQTLYLGSTDLGIIITSDKNPVNDGDNITINITITNNGIMDAYDVNITIIFPYGLIINNYTNNSGIYNNTTNIWHFDIIHPNENFTITFNATLTDPGPNLIINATIENNTSIYEENITNNTQILNITVIQWSDLEIFKNVSDLHPDTKDNITYTITVYNYGPSTASNVTVFDNLSSKLIYQISNATKGYYNETTGIWIIDNITPNSTEILNITVLINQSGIIENFVNVSCPNNDSNWTNNYANITFETAPLSDLWVTINMEPQSSNYITYHIQAGNNGIEAANGTVVVFNLSNLYVWFNHTTDKGLYDNGTGVWDIGYLDVDEVVNMTLIVRLDFPMGTTFANITTSVNITSWSTDLYPENNTDNVTFQAEIFGNFRLLQDIVDSWPENTTQILPRSFAYDPVQDAMLPGETYDLINGVRLYKNVTIVNPYGFTLGGFDTARIFNISADNVILDGLRFFNGNSPLGAALNIHANNVQVLRSNFSGNWLFGDYGGAIYTGGQNTLIMDNIFTENVASKLGGAIGSVGANNLQIINNTFINNSVESDEIFGGAIGLINTTANVNGNVFLDNTATSSTGLGSAIYTDNSNVNLEANWFGNNTPDILTDKLIWGVKPETYIILDWEILNPNMAAVTLNAVFFLYNTTTGNKTRLNYGTPYRTLTVTARDPTLSWYNTTYTGNNTFNYTYNPSIPVYQVNATVDYQTITLEWSTFLNITKTLLNDTIWFGDDLIYNITIINYGPHNSYVITISDLLPENLIINNVNATYGSTSIFGDNVYWTVTVNPDSTLNLIVNTTPTREGIYVNNVTVNSTSQYDYFLTGNTTNAIAEILPLFDLSINFTISPPPYYVGENINYTITIHNNGPSNATNVSVYIPIPSGLTFLYAWNLDGYIPNYTSSTGLWNVDTLHVNETIQINMTLGLTNPGWYNQTVNITGHGVELNESDNNQTISFNVTSQVDLELNMTISTNETIYGSPITITYSLLNKGPSTATNVTMFTVFTGLTYYWASGYGSFINITPFTGYWYVGNLNNGSIVTLTLYFYTNNLGDFIVTGRANCSDNESYWPDNYNNVTLKVIKYADLSITKTVSTTTPYIGQVINYTITVTNNGIFDAENVTVYDNLSDSLIYNGSNPNFNGTHWFVGNLTVGESKNITFNVTVNGVGIIWNNVTVNSSLYDPNTDNNHAEVNIIVSYNSTDLSITKTVSSTSPFLLSNITYTINVTNNGLFAAYNVTVYDLLPTVLIYNNTTAGFNGTEWFIGTLNPGESRNISFNVTVDGIGDIWNNVTVNSTTPDSDYTNNHAEVVIHVPVSDDLRIYLNVIPSTPSSNTMFLINVSVWNYGYENNNDVYVEFHIPIGLTWISDTSSGAYNSSTGIWYIGVLGNGQWTNMEIWVMPTVAGNITLQANVTGQVADPAPWNNRANLTFEIVPLFDLSISKIANTTNITDGDYLTFTITASNKGPYTATNVKIIDTLPEGVIYLINNASGIYDNITRTVNWTIPNLDVNETRLIELRVRSWNPGTSFTNTVNISAYGVDNNITDNTATCTINVSQIVDLEVKLNASKIVDIDLGENITFTVTVINHGPSNATGVIANFIIPNIFTLISENSLGNYNNLTGDWLIGNLASGENITLVLNLTLNSTGKCVANTTVNGTYPDTNITNNYDELNITATRISDLNITAYWSNNSIYWYDLSNLTIIVSNSGPDDAINVTVTLNISGLTFVNSTGDYNETLMIWNVGNLSVGEYKNITITFNGTICGLWNATVNITAHGIDNDTSNNNFTVDIAVLPIVDLIMTNLTVNTTFTGLDSILEFNVTVYNAGPCNATNTTILGLLPLNWTIFGGNISADIPINTSHTFNILVNASSCGNFTVGFNATINGLDTNISNNWMYIGPIEVIYSADLMITIQTSNEYPIAGDIVVYVITVSNLDWHTAHNVTANITIPSNLTFSHYYLASGVYNLGNGTWTIGNLSFRNSTSLFLFARVNTPNNTSFWVNVSGDDYDFNLENNNDTCTISAVNGLDLNITLCVDNSTPYTGYNLTFAVIVENIGLINATGVSVDLNIPSGLANIRCADLNFTGTSWYIGNLTSGSSKTLTFIATPVMGILTVNATVSSDKFDYVVGNNFANLSVCPINVVDLEVNITCNNMHPMINENVTYTITALNKGPVNVDNVFIYNNLPNSIVYSTSTPSYNPILKTWTINNLTPNTPQTLNITINHTTTGTFNYTANITGNTLETNTTNNLNTITITIYNYNDLITYFTASNTTTTDNELLNFTITIYNNGPFNYTNTIIHTNLPNTTKYNGTEIFDTNQGIWNIGNITAYENKTLTLTINMTNPGNHTYWANATSKEPDKNLTNNNQSINITIQPNYDIHIKITQNTNTTLNIGENASFTITVWNEGPSTANNVQISDNIFGTPEYISKGTYTNNTWTIGTLTSKETQTLKLNKTLTNNGTITYNIEATLDNIIFDRNITNNKDNTTITILNGVDLIITIQSNTTLTNKSNNIEITITIYNNGTNTANNIIINTNRLFENIINITNTAGFISSTQWFIPTLNPYTNETLKITRTITNDTQIQTNATSDNTELNNNTNHANLTINITKFTDLQITLKTNNTNPNIGDNITLTTTIYNKGEDTAENVKVYLNLPYSTNYTNVHMYDSLNGIWDVGTLPNGTNKTLNITITLNTPGTITFNTTTYTTTNDINLTNNKDNITLNINNLVDLKINLTINSTDILVGDNITFTITVQNNGPGNATGVISNINLPGTISYINKGIYTGNTWNIGNLNKDETTTLKLTSTLTLTDSGIHTLNITSTDTDKNLTNNNITLNLSFKPSSDLEIQITSSTTNINVTKPLNYTITIFNHGINNITNANVNFKLPNDLIISNNLTTNGIFTNNTWTLGTLNAGNNATLYIYAHYNNSGNKNIEIFVNSTNYDFNITNNYANLTTIVIPQTDLHLNFTTTGHYNPDGTINFNITITNYGPSTAENITIHTNLDITDNYNLTKGYFDTLQNTWYINTLNTGETEILTLNTTAIKGIQYYANATSTTEELNNIDNIKYLNLTAPPLADLSIKISSNTTTLPVNDNVNFTITVTNLGPYNATGVNVYTTLPPSSTYTITKGLYDTLNGIWNIGNLNKDETAKLNIIINITNTGKYTYIAFVNTSSNDTNISNNNDTINLTIFETTDLSIKILSNKTTFTVGENTTFTLNLSNLGQNNATNITVHFTLENFTITNINTNTGTFNNNTWNITKLTNNTSILLNITGFFTTNGTKKLHTNLTSLTIDNNTNNNQDTLTCNILNPYDLEISITANTTNIYAGEYLELTINITNHGPGIAENIQIKTNILNATSTKTKGYYDKDTGNIYINNLNNNSTIQIKLTKQIKTNTTFTTNITNTDLNNTNNNDTLFINVLDCTDLNITVTANTLNPYFDDDLTYTITVTNTGYSLAENTTVNTNLPNTGFKFINANSTNYINGLWTIGNLNTGESVILTLNFKTNKSGLVNAEFNTTTNTYESNTLNNNVNLTVNVSNNYKPSDDFVDLIINITTNNTNPNINETVLFNITVFNNASTTANNLTILSFLPSGLTPIGTYTNNWTLTNLTGYNNASFTFIANVTSYGSFVTNTSVDCIELDHNPINNRANTLIICSAPNTNYVDLTINITRKGNITLGETFTYNITATNIGSNTATNVNCTISLFNGLTVINQSNNEYNDTSSVWNIGNLTSGESKTLELTINTTNTGYYNNAFLVWSNENDAQPQNNLILDNFEINDTKIDINTRITANKTYITNNETILFTVTVTNPSQNTATDVNITLNIPNEFTNINITGNDTNNSYYIGNLTSESTFNFTFTAKLNSTNPSTITVNTTLNETDYNLENNIDSITISPIGNNTNGIADLQINITVNEQYPEIETVPIFNIWVTNNGPDDATNIEVPIYIPADCISTSADTYWDNSTSTFRLANLSVGFTIKFEVSFRISTTQPILFNASAKSDQFDPNITDNKASISLYPWEATPTCDLNITIVPIGDEFHANDTVKFNVTIRNFGEKTAFNVSVHNIIPPGLTLESISTTWAYTLTSDGWFMPNHTINTNKSFILTYKIDNKGLYQTTMEVNTSTLDVDPTSNGMGVAIYAGEAEPNRRNVTTKTTGTVAVATLNGNANWAFKGTLKMANTTSAPTQNFPGQKLYANITSDSGFELVVESIDVTGSNGVANFQVNSAQLMTGAHNYKVTIFYKGEKTDDTYYLPSTATSITRKVTVNP